MLSLSFLGTFAACMNDESIREFESNKVRALLAYLVMEADRPHSRDQLAGMFWGESNDEIANKNLRQALSNLRKTIHDEQAEHPLLTITATTIQANSNSELRLDAAEFERLLAACQTHPHRMLETCSACACRMDAALALYRGGFLEGFFLKEADTFQDWIVVRREHFLQQAVDALRVSIAFHRRRGEINAAIKRAQQLMALDPWREEAHVLLMELLALDGQRSAALKRFEICRKVLMKELGVEPQEETVRLAEAIRDGSLPKVQERSAPSNLPVEATSFVGRQSELAQISEYIQSRDRRLLTIIGAGGVGKTRLALQAAHAELFAFPDGVFWAPLNNVPNAESLPLAIAESIDFSFPIRGAARAQIIQHLRRKNLLLVLDNFEHLLDGADFVADLLRAAPGLTVLVTSRQPLQIQAEWLLELNGLDARPPHSDPQPAPVFSDSVRLFEDRARRSLPDFTVTSENHEQVTRLCQMLDGLPLGIELAAAWARLFTPAQMSERIGRDLDFLASDLRDTPERHRSLRVVFDQSWDMLSEMEKDVFASLSIFPATFDKNAAQEICGADGRILNQLWQKSLLRQHAPERYSLHPLLKQYGREKLTADKLCTLTHLFQDYHAALAVKLESQIQSAGLKSALERGSDELENLVEAWRLALSEARLKTLNDLLTPLFWYYEIKGRIYEGHVLFQDAAKLLHEKKRPRRAEVNFARRLSARLAWLSFRRSEMDDAIVRFQGLVDNGLESLKPNEQVFVMTRFASVTFEQGHKEEALRWFASALDLCAQVHAPWEWSLTDNHYGSAQNMLGDLERAEESLRRGLQTAEENGYLWVSASALSNLAVTAYFREDYRAAIEMFMQSNEKALAYGDEHHSASINHSNLADCYLQLGELDHARVHLDLALFHFNECGNTVFLPYVYNTLAGIQLRGDNLKEAKAFLDLGIQSALEHNMVSALNNLLADYARYYFMKDDRERSAAIVNYVLQSEDTIKEGKDKAAKLVAELGKLFHEGDGKQYTRTSILELIRGDRDSDVR
jgi:predicted ATPase